MSDFEQADLEKGRESEDSSEPACRNVDWLRQDLGAEYYAIVGVVGAFDQRFLTIKGWSVTLSLAALGLGFQYQRAAFFALAALSGLSFWLLDWLGKRHQLHYYSRMRDIEYCASRLNSVRISQRPGEKGGPLEASAPQIDMAWGFEGYKKNQNEKIIVDEREQPVTRRSPENVHKLLSKALLMPYVALPHVVPVFSGLALCLIRFLKWPPVGSFPW